jgi:hypothetical protein
VTAGEPPVEADTEETMAKTIDTKTFFDAGSLVESLQEISAGKDLAVWSNGKLLGRLLVQQNEAGDTWIELL